MLSPSCRYIFPPGNATYSLKPAAQWLHDHYNPHLQEGLEFTQEAGDVFFLPSGWGHLTYNEGTSVGAAVEFGYLRKLTTTPDYS